MKRGLVFDFHRGTTHDGPGMRTTVFFKGCPLHCKWCHNPESISPKPELQWDGKKCIGCRTCVNSCPKQALEAGEEGIRILKDRCQRCFQCATHCPAKAMRVTGKDWELPQLVREACKDQIFFEEFGGGVTASGGEPMAQHEFVGEFLKELKGRGIHTALDTSGFATWEKYEKLYPYVDTFLYDMKLIDDQEHKLWTGVSNRLILNNLVLLAEGMRQEGKRKLWIRTPLIPGATAQEDNIRGIGQWIRRHVLDVVERWELCAFNNVCREKYEKLGMEWFFAQEPLMTKEEVESLAAIGREWAGERLVVSGLTKVS